MFGGGREAQSCCVTCPESHSISKPGGLISEHGWGSPSHLSRLFLEIRSLRRPLSPRTLASDEPHKMRSCALPVFLLTPGLGVSADFRVTKSAFFWPVLK